jgi:hypothetical protein
MRPSNRRLFRLKRDVRLPTASEHEIPGWSYRQFVPKGQAVRIFRGFAPNGAAFDHLAETLGAEKPPALTA